MAVPDRKPQGPKTVELVAALREFPTEIESDLSLYHGFDIADWWRGEKSSRWVWVRVMGLPEKSETKTAMREGDWTEGEYLTARAINEIMYFRADHAAVHASHKMRVSPIESPGQRLEKAKRERARDDVRSMLLAQMRGEYVPEPREVTFEHIDTVKGGNVNG